MKRVVLIFGGRECYLKILFPLIEKYSNHIDEFRIYVATTIQSDIDYMEFFSKTHSYANTIYCKIDDKIILDDKNLIWDNAYKSCQEPDTVYLKMDDDIVYFDETLFTDFIQYRIQNRTAPLLYPIIINNPFISCMLQDKNVYKPLKPSTILTTWPKTYQRIKPYILENNHQRIRIGDIARDEEILCPIGWGDVEYCYNLHNQFIGDVNQGNIQKYYLDEKIVVKNCEPVSINVCSWIGEDLQQYTNKYGDVYHDENWWSIYLPTWSGNYNEIYGKCVVSHYAFYRQRELGIDSTDILEKYYHFCKLILS